MSTDDVAEASVSLDDIDSVDPEVASSKIDLIVEMSSNGEMSTELGIVDEVLTRMELDLACASEKLVNLSVLMMHVATKESEFEATSSTKGDLLGGSLEALEFDLLSRILDSEVTELDNFMTTVQENIVEAHKMISSYEHLGETFIAMEEKVRDCEESLKRSQDRVAEIREQSAEFQRTFSCLKREENWDGNEGSNFMEDGQYSDIKTKIKMQTAEEQRRILRMLEKSLAKEMDLDKQLTEARQIEKVLKRRLLSIEQELFFVEEEAIDVCERCFTAENAAEVLMGISKELLSRFHILQINLNGSIQRGSELRSKLERSIELLESKENALWKFNSGSAKSNDTLLEPTDNLDASLIEAEEKLIFANSEILTLKEKMTVLEKQLKGSVSQLLNVKDSVVESQDEHTMEGLKEELAEIEFKCKKLAETIMELNEKLGLFKGISERVNSLEKQLVESDIKLQHALASADASQEEQNMLCATMRDMENLIEGLKLKAFKAENRAKSAEDRCIILSESNVGLNEELSFLRERLESLGVSLIQAEETKITAAKDIGFRTKVITDLVMQLAIEREHLHKQMASLALENKTLVWKLRQTKKDEHLFRDDVTPKAATDPKVDKTQKDALGREAEVAAIDSKLVPENVRRIDAGVLSSKQILMAILILLIAGAVYLFQPQQQLR